MAKVKLAPGESKQVSIKVTADRLSIFDEGSDSWKLALGECVLQVAGSSQELPLQEEVSY